MLDDGARNISSRLRAPLNLPSTCGDLFIAGLIGSISYCQIRLISRFGFRSDQLIVLVCRITSLQLLSHSRIRRLGPNGALLSDDGMLVVSLSGFEV